VIVGDGCGLFGGEGGESRASRARGHRHQRILRRAFSDGRGMAVAARVRMHLSQIMSTPVETIAADDSVATARARFALNGIHHLVVVRDGDVVGVLSTADLGPWVYSEAEQELPVADCMETPVCATPATTIEQAANLLVGHSASCLPVLKHGRLTGVVTITDLLQLLGRGAERPAQSARRWRRTPR
jgi:acetoin utilization protein AcuB